MCSLSQAFILLQLPVPHLPAKSHSMTPLCISQRKMNALNQGLPQILVSTPSPGISTHLFSFIFLWNVSLFPNWYLLSASKLFLFFCTFSEISLYSLCSFFLMSLTLLYLMILSNLCLSHFHWPHISLWLLTYLSLFLHSKFSWNKKSILLFPFFLTSHSFFNPK